MDDPRQGTETAVDNVRHRSTANTDRWNVVGEHESHCDLQPDDRQRDQGQNPPGCRTATLETLEGPIDNEIEPLYPAVVIWRVVYAD